MKSLSMFAWAALCMLGASQASANEAVVSYADLDLAKPVDQARLHGRVVSVARDLCDLRPAPGSFIPSSESTACFKEAVQRANDQVADAVHQSGRGTTLAMRSR